MAFDFGAFGQAAATSAAQSVIGTGLNAIFAKRNIKLQNKQFAWQQDRTNQMNVQNMLNNAQYQKQSLLNAGLNPAMISEGNYSSPVTAPTPSAKGSDMFATPMDMASFMQANATTKLAEAQAKLVEEQAKGQGITNDNLQRQFDDAHRGIEKTLEEQDANIDNLKENLKLLGKQGLEIDSKIDILKKEYEQIDNDILIAKERWLQEKGFNEQRMSNENKIAAAQVFKLYQDGKLSSAQAQVAYKTIEVYDENMKEIRSRVGLNDKQGQQLDLLIKSGSIDLKQKESSMRVLESIGLDKISAEKLYLELKKLDTEGYNNMYSMIHNLFSDPVGTSFLPKGTNTYSFVGNKTSSNSKSNSKVPWVLRNKGKK